VNNIIFKLTTLSSVWVSFPKQNKKESWFQLQHLKPMFIKSFLFIKYNMWMSSPWVLFRLLTATVIIVSAATPTITTMVRHHQPGREKLQELHILTGFYILIFNIWINNMYLGYVYFPTVDMSVLSLPGCFPSCSDWLLLFSDAVLVVSSDELIVSCSDVVVISSSP